jgi:hypothetical protein
MTSRLTAIRGLAAAVALLGCTVHTARAQGSDAGRLEGTVTDSVHARPLSGVRVIALGTESPERMRGEATTGTDGGFRIDSLPPGRYMIGFESPLLDSLEITPPPRAVTIEPARAASVELALPPASRLRAAVCPGVTLPPGTGAIYGRVVDAETDSPLSGVTVALAWRELDFDRTTLRSASSEGTAAVTTDAGGWYLVCQVPTGARISMQLQREERAGPVIQTFVDDTLGIAIRHLSFSAGSTRPIAETPEEASAGTVSPSGTAKLSGVVRGAGDVPVAMAEVMVRGAVARARTDSLGRYALAGLPAGTQMLEVRRVGYALLERPVALRPDMTMTADVGLQRVVNLDSMRVVAIQSRYTEFEEHRKHSIAGRFLGPKEMQWQRIVPYTSNIVEKFPSFHIVGEGPRAVVISNAFGKPCGVNVVIDGAEHQSINDIPAIVIGAMELYRQGDVLPPEVIDSWCGAIVIWTKRER